MQDEEELRIQRLEEELSKARAVKRKKDNASKSLKGAQNEIKKAIKKYRELYDSLCSELGWSESTARRKGLLSPSVAYKECKAVLDETESSTDTETQTSEDNSGETIQHNDMKTHTDIPSHSESTYQVFEG